MSERDVVELLRRHEATEWIEPDEWVDALTAQAARIAELERERDENDRLIAGVMRVVSPHWFLDPPDGGDVKFHEGVKRIEDAWKAAEARNAVLVEALTKIDNLDESCGHNLNEGHAFDAVAIARAALSNGDKNAPSSD